MDIKESLIQFNTVSLEEINSVSLMNRIDVKFAFKKRQLPALLSDLRKFYNVLQINDMKIQAYKSLYYDTSDRIFMS